MHGSPVARGEGRSTKSCTPKLRAFARAVRTAQAQARAAREIEVARRDPKWWLSHVGRSRPGREGWTEPVYPDEVPEPQARPPYTPTDAEALLR